MKLATTTGDFSGYGSSFEEIIEIMSKTPFRYLDCGLGCEFLKKNPELLGDKWLNKIKKIKDCAESKGMQFVQAHAPMGRPLVKGDHYNEFMFMTKRSIEIAAALGAGNIVVHSGYRSSISKEKCFEENKVFYGELLPIAEKTGINILTENFNKMCLDDLYWVDSAKDERELIEFVNHPLFHACWDTGHGNMQETTQSEALGILNEHVYALHVQDNLGDNDHHFAPYFGTMDLDSLMRGLIEIKYDGFLRLKAQI